MSRAPGRSGPLGGVLEIGFEDADAGEVAVAFGEIETVADDEFIGDGETHEVGLEFDLATTTFIEEHASADAGGVEFLDHGDDGGDGFAGVEDVVDEEDVAVGDVEAEAAEDLGLADGAGLVAVAGDADTVEADGVRNFAEEVGGEEDGPVNEGDDGDFLLAVGGGDEGAELANAFLEVGFGDEDGFEGGGNGGGFSGGH